MDIIVVLQIMIGIIIFVMFLLVLFYLYLIRPRKTKSEESVVSSGYGDENKQDKKADNYGRFQGELSQESIFDFMEFDEVIDNMIVRKNKTQYIMVLQCNGVNYDLMSEQEKIGVEEGFVQFLNTLRFPIQLYVQSRTLNLKDIIAGYEERVNTLNNDINKLDAKIEQAKRAGNNALQEKLYFEKRRKQNVLEYGIDITNYVAKLNSNQNILQQRTYVIVSFFTSELGGNLDNYSKDELDSMCFSELYTRCQNVSSSLMSSQVSSRILESEELMELLYIAYNRDESEIYQLQKALDAQYDALYSTGKDVLQKRQEKLDQEINIAAFVATFLGSFFSSGCFSIFSFANSKTLGFNWSSYWSNSEDALSLIDCILFLSFSKSSICFCLSAFKILSVAMSIAAILISWSRFFSFFFVI